MREGLALRRAGLFGALAAGFLAALALSGFPASAANQSIVANDDAGPVWKPNAVTIQAGESVTWATDGGFHDVCVLKPGATGDNCDNSSTKEFKNGDPAPSWSAYTNSHTFTTAGTYTFFCEVHKGDGMTGTITVTAASTGTTTTETTQTMTTNTETGTQTTPVEDTTAPHFSPAPKRRASKRSIVLAFGSSEAAKLSVSVAWHAAGKHHFSHVGSATVGVKHGNNVVTVPRKAAGKLRAGSYRLTLRLTDASGNHSAAKTLTFTRR